MNIATLLRRGSPRRILVGLVGLVIVLGVLTASFYDTKHPLDLDHPGPGHSSKAFVVASREEDDTSWLYEHFSDWVTYRYIVDKPSAQFTVPKNKGREAMVYLSFMIDAYDSLPDVMVFIHSDRYQWHNDDPLYDGVPMLRGLQLPYIISQGYANIRCVWALGCPSEIKLDEQIDLNREDDLRPTQTAYKQSFQELFPGELIPASVGVACCAQFAVTREKIRERPLEDYKHYRQWLLDTPLDDSVSGRIFEYSWHIIFGKPYTHCPNAKECYCNIFGLCNLECDGEDKCGERWPYPPYSSLPKGWPMIGWDGKSRGPDVLENLKNVAISSANDSSQDSGISYDPGMGSRAELETFKTNSFVRIRDGGAQYNGLPNTQDGLAGSFCTQCGVKLQMVLKSHIKAIPTSRTGHSRRHYRMDC